MNKAAISVALAALLLGACATEPGRGSFRPFPETFEKAAFGVANASVNVVDDNNVVVDREPIYVRQSSDRDNTIYWYLDPAGPYSFAAENGIEFAPPPLPGLRCNRDESSAKVYVCNYKRDAPRQRKFPYTIRVTKDGKTIIKSDPTVMNN
jgi:hypothetical protein